jgi:oligoribonuclease NrnB/cAMP/cGMP phosphodiesterase (DHH superfamily)
MVYSIPMVQCVITHTDSDGLLSLATFLKTVPADQPVKVLFSSPTRLFSTIASAIDENDEENELLYVFDLAGTRETLVAGLVFDKSIWVDHHTWEPADITHERMEVMNDPASPSAAQLVARYFKITSGLESVAEEIDTNQIKSPEAQRLRDLVDAYKGRDDWETVSKSLQQLARNLAANGPSEVMKEEYNALLEEYGAWAKKVEDRARELLQIHKVKDYKVAVVDSLDGLPVYLVNRALLAHPEAPFDVVIALNRQPGMTRVEFRTQKGYDVLKLARWLGGGGHKMASGAHVEKKVKVDELLKIID